MNSEEKEEVYQEFKTLVNLQPQELEDFLETEESKSVGWSEDGGESVGHQSGRRIVKIKRTNKDELSNSQYQHMKKVVGYLKRHLAQEPENDVEDSNWRYSLMNWGHDPLKE